MIINAHDGNYCLAVSNKFLTFGANVGPFRYPLTKRIPCNTNNTEVTDMAMLSVRLSEETHRRLKRLSEKTKRTKTSFIREMIENSLADYEEAYTALDRLNEKNAKYLTSEELEKELGL